MAEKPFNRRLFRSRRRALRLSCKALASLAEPSVDTSTVAKIEKGKFRPSVDVARALEKALAKAEGDNKANPGLHPDRLKRRRRDAKLTMQALADKANLSKRTIWQVENGKYPSNKKRVGGATEATVTAIDEAVREVEQEPSIGARLRAELEARGLRMRDLAKSSGVGVNTICAIVNGQTRPKPRTSEKLYEALGTIPPVTPGSAIRERRHKLRISAERLADESRVSLATLSRIENGEACHATTLTRLNKALDKLAQESEAAPIASETAVPSGEEIRRARAAVGLSQAELARRVGISQQALWFIEQDRFKGRLGTIRIIERVLTEARLGVARLSQASRLYSKASRAAKARWGQPPIPNEAQRPIESTAHSVEKLSAMEEEVLDGLLAFKAFRSGRRICIGEIAKKRQLNDSTLRRAGAKLKARGMIDSKEGREGGCWLTPKGKATAEQN